LVETLIAITIFGLIVVVVSGIVLVLYKTQSYAWQQSLAVEEARRGVKIMVKEIREANNGDDGSFIIEKADDKEFVFYSDIDKDDLIEKVRYFIGGVNSGLLEGERVSFGDGGYCDTAFNNFLEGVITSASLEVSLEGDFGMANEYADIYADGQYLGRVCEAGCFDCAGNWQGNTVFNVIDFVQDGAVDLRADSSSYVNNNCDWIENNHSIKARFRLSYEEEIEGMSHQLKKGVTNPVGSPLEYPSDQENVSIVSSYIRNESFIFEYFDGDGNKITDYPAKLIDTKMMKVYLVVNVDPGKAPDDFCLESYVKLRNLE